MGDGLKLAIVQAVDRDFVAIDLDGEPRVVVVNGQGIIVGVGTDALASILFNRDLRFPAGRVVASVESEGAEAHLYPLSKDVGGD